MCLLRAKIVVLFVSSQDSNNALGFCLYLFFFEGAGVFLDALNAVKQAKNCPPAFQSAVLGSYRNVLNDLLTNGLTNELKSPNGHLFTGPLKYAAIVEHQGQMIFMGCFMIMRCCCLLCVYFIHFST